MSGEKGKASEIIAKQIGVSSKTVEKTRVVLKEATPEQLEAIKKDELSMNQVFNQIQEKKPKTEKPKVSTAPTSEPKAEAEQKAEPTAEEEKPDAKAAFLTEEAFAKGVRHAIAEIRKGVSLEALEKSLSA